MALLFNSCKTEDDEGIPSYIHIGQIDLTTTASQGTASHKIADAWIYIEDKLIGVFELPATFPVLKSGNYDIKIYCGIKVNGIAATRSPYPFYKPIITTVSLERGNIDTLFNLSTIYEPTTTFLWMENFDAGSLTIDTTSASQTKLHRISNPDLVFKYKNELNEYSVMASLTGDSLLFECASITNFTLPKGGTPVFLEMNYRNNYPLTTGMYVTTSNEVFQQAVLVLNPSEQWNKIYINLTPTISYFHNADNFKIFIGMLKSNASDTAAVYLDNIKLIY